MTSLGYKLLGTRIVLPHATSALLQCGHGQAQAQAGITVAFPSDVHSPPSPIQTSESLGVL